MQGRVGFKPGGPVLLFLAACVADAPDVAIDILGTFPHDSASYTQGLLFHEGHLYESTGRYGSSSLRKVDPRSGEVIESVSLDSTFFAEGLALTEAGLIQLTWKSGVAFVYDLETLQPERQFTYSGEGWGLCFDGSHFYMSNGTSTLVRRDAETFAVISEVSVSHDGLPLSQLNELECVGPFVYANVYPSDRIVQIDKESGEVVGVIDGFTASLATRRPNAPGAVLNGIAYVPETDVFLVTGKLWPHVIAMRPRRE